MGAVEAVIFDLDDTLYPERQFAYSGYAAVASAFSDRLGRSSGELTARMRKLFDSTERGRVFNVLLAEAGIRDADALLPSMIETFRFHFPRINLHEDADRAMQRLAVQVRLGIISDGPLQMQSNKVAALGAASRVDEVILTDEWGQEYWKPHPRAFEEMSRRLGVPHERCVYVADNPGKDFVAPNAMGWHTVFVRRPDGVYRDVVAAEGGEAAAVVETLDALR